ncbi:MAG: DNA-binding protein [Campylobacterota bacterium]|nr:DNA-binding protein [Campylobacterota bacterium]
MKKMSVLNAAQHFGVSKEAIYNRIRRGSLKTTIENSVKLVIIDEMNTPVKKNLTQNNQLLKKIELLESEVDTLRKEKESILLEMQATIKQIYREKDKQLTEILIALEFKGLVEKTIEIEKESSDTHLTPLKEYLKQQKLSEKKIQNIKAKFKRKSKKDDRIIVIDKKYYLDLEKYDYRDLL